MIILILFAFLAGIVTVLSPCILPVLPIVLSGGISGSKHKPFGIVAGFVASFTFFTLFLSTIVRLTGISPDSLRTFSVVVIILFGASLLIPRVQIILEQVFSKLAGTISGKSQQSQQTDFMSGFVIGLSLGLLWTPCVGPILASVISLALTGSVSGAAIGITAAYAMGTAIPMFFIIYGGRQLLLKVPWLTANTGTIQKAFGVLMILTGLAIHFNIDRQFQTYVLTTFPKYGAGLTQLEDNSFIKTQLEALTDKPLNDGLRGRPMDEVLNNSMNLAPELIPGGAWFNSKPLTIQGLRGKVVLIDFWTYTCINCIRTLPYLRAWHEKYSDAGLVILGVHTPEFEFEKNPDNVQKAIDDFELKYPIVQDNNFDTWRAYNNRYWPAKYLIDATGAIRYTHFGEGAYDETEQIIQQLLEEAGNTINVDINNPTYQVQSRTPELYLGLGRIEYLASPEKIIKDTPTSYSTPPTLTRNSFALDGTWTIGDEYAMPTDGASLILNYESQEVFLVMRPIGVTPGKARISLDGKLVDSTSAGDDVKDGIVTIDTDRLYKLIKLPTPGPHIITIEFLDANIETFAFTFG